MADTDALHLRRLPREWVAQILERHSTSPRHRPAERTVLQVLNALAVTFRKRDGATYTDDTVPQLARACGLRDGAVTDVLTVLERARWSVTIVRGGPGRGSRRDLPIIRYLANAYRNGSELPGECPREFPGELPGESAPTDGDRRPTHGDSPRPPSISIRREAGLAARTPDSITARTASPSASLDTARPERSTPTRPPASDGEPQPDGSTYFRSERLLIWPDGRRERYTPGAGWSAER